MSGVPRSKLVIPFGELDHTPSAHEFVGADHRAPFSVILVHVGPGGGPAVHRHPYAEVFIVEVGEATFRLGNETTVVPAGHVVVGPPMTAHGFTNTGEGDLRLVAIHGAPAFMTEWLEGVDEGWVSRPRRRTDSDAAR